MLPDIVRAAAEPMGNIGSLTVLSSDGASDVVRTTTRTVAEAGAAVKGLTGLDIPALINTAVNQQGARQPSPAAGPVGRAPRPAPAAASQSARAPQRPPSARAESATAEPAEAFAEAVDTIQRAGAVPAPSSSRSDVPSLTLPDDVSVPDAAAALGRALRAVPGARRYAEMPLGDLANRGPRLARSLWTAVPERLRASLGERTIGQLLDEQNAR
jgi:hypothetical protein